MTYQDFRSTRAWRRLREQVFTLYGRKCWYCGQPATHVDHLVPLNSGGYNSIENLVPACKRCNLRKGDRTKPLRPNWSI